MSGACTPAKQCIIVGGACHVEYQVRTAIDKKKLRRMKEEDLRELTRLIRNSLHIHLPLNVFCLLVPLSTPKLCHILPLYYLHHNDPQLYSNCLYSYIASQIVKQSDVTTTPQSNGPTRKLNPSTGLSYALCGCVALCAR